VQCRVVANGWMGGQEGWVVQAAERRPWDEKEWQAEWAKMMMTCRQGRDRIGQCQQTARVGQGKHWDAGLGCRYGVSEECRRVESGSHVGIVLGRRRVSVGSEGGDWAAVGGEGGGCVGEVKPGAEGRRAGAPKREAGGRWRALVAANGECRVRSSNPAS
jgi:hypothetical protein